MSAPSVRALAGVRRALAARRMAAEAALASAEARLRAAEDAQAAAAADLASLAAATDMAGAQALTAWQARLIARRSEAGVAVAAARAPLDGLRKGVAAARAREDAAADLAESLGREARAAGDRRAEGAPPSGRDPLSPFSGHAPLASVLSLSGPMAPSPVSETASPAIA
ncbi:MAG: hypothetical protein RQ752_08170 [Thermohalobaculum sp.]|nr:hypothetical protein [Thermohalobaculum sp.]